MPDGSIVFSTELDNKELVRQLAKTKKEIEKLKESISEKEAKKSPLVQQAQALEGKMRAARAEVEKYGAAWERGVAGADKNQSEALATAQQLEAQHAKVVAQIDKIDAKLGPAYDKVSRMEETAGGLEKELAAASGGTSSLAPALNKADKYLEKFVNRVKGLARRVFVFTLITTALRSLRDWFGSVIKANTDASAAIARLEGALLTLVQPLVDVIVPAFTTFANVLADIIGKVATLVSTMFGTTVEDSAAAAEGLNEEREIIEGVGDSAEKASKSLANFDDVNKLSGDSNKNKEGIKPDFSSVGDMDWLKNTLGDAADMVTAALLLGGIALIAIGASMGSLPIVVAGIFIINSSFTVGGETGALKPWVEALGLNSVEEFVAVAIALAGITLVAIGAATGNILLVIAGLGLIWGMIAYANTSGMMESWTEEQVSRAATYITAALLLGGIVLIAIGAATANILMVLAGLGLLAAGVYVGVKSGTLESWAKKLGLETVFDYVVAAIALVGIALIAIGTMMGNIFMVVAGAIILTVGVAADAIGEETLRSWWEVLKLTNIQQWVSVALLLVGIALIAIGAMMGNILMVLAGAGLLALSIIVGVQNDNLKDWVAVMGLEKIVGWVTAVLLLAGMAFVVFGIITHNVLMVVAGIGLLIAGFVVGTESGTFESWADTLHLDDVSGKVTAAIMLAGIALIAIGAIMLNPLMVLAGLGILGVGFAANRLTAKSVGGGSASKAASVSYAMPSITQESIPRLATGAVIPANREFMAVLGDQKSGNNIEAPESLIRKIVREETGGMRGNTDQPLEVNLYLQTGEFLGRAMLPSLELAARHRGVSLSARGGGR